MLPPDYYDTLTDDLIRLYSDLDNAIIADITRRILKTGKITESAEWQIKQLQESGFLYDDILAEIAKRTDATENHVRTLFQDAGITAVKFDNQFYRSAGLSGIIRLSPAAAQVLDAGFQKCSGSLKNLTLTTAVTAQQEYINACNSAYMQITSGAFSYQEAIRNAIKSAAESGTSVLYPSGHVDRLDVAVRRAVLTGVGQTARKLSEINAGEVGCDLMEITAHSGARPEHAVWQGQLVSLSGKNAGKIIDGRKVLSLNEIGYGSGDGFGGWNCRHDWYPFFEGLSQRAYSDERLKELNEKKIEYNGRKYSEYEISQIQRRYEREIRAAKREQTAFRTAVEETDDPELKSVMQDSLNYANDVVRRKQAKMRDFIRQTGQSRDYFREQNYGRVPYQNEVQSDFIDNARRNIKNKFTSNKIIPYSELPEDLKSSFESGLKHSEQRTATIITEALKKADIMLTDNKSTYYPRINIINIQRGCSLGTIAHETFHYIDHRYNINKRYDLYTHLQKDWSNLLKRSNGDVIEYLMQNYPDAFTISGTDKIILKKEYRGISDIISGLSKGKINFGYHHDSKYWENREKLKSESWAQFGRIYYDNDEKVRKMFSDLFTNYESYAIICLEEMI